MSCGLLALNRAGIKVDNYYSAEIKPMALKLQKYHYVEGNTPYRYFCQKFIQIGDVNKISYKDGRLAWEDSAGPCSDDVKIDLVCFGSPCQSFSRAMREERRVGLEDKVRSGLFLECARILKEVNPKYFLMENVVMRKEDEDVITSMLGVKPVRINSSLVTAQLRDRLYWTNIPGVKVPADKGIKLQDILTDGYAPFEKARCLMMCDSHGYYNGCGWTPSRRFHRTFYKAFSTMVFPDKESYEKAKAYAEKLLGGRRPSRAEYYEGCDESVFKPARYLWKGEREQDFRQFLKTM
jgi:DNA (cytosine-5)-methyltransferase 3A